jgi:hypothetical protein
MKIVLIYHEDAYERRTVSVYAGNELNLIAARLLTDYILCEQLCMFEIEIKELDYPHRYEVSEKTADKEALALLDIYINNESHGLYKKAESYWSGRIRVDPYTLDYDDDLIPEFSPGEFFTTVERGILQNYELPSWETYKTWF